MRSFSLFVLALRQPGTARTGTLLLVRSLRRSDRLARPPGRAVAAAARTFARGALVGPDLQVVDLALIQRLPWARPGAAGKVELRLETFNVSNGPPSASHLASSPSPGLPSDTQHGQPQGAEAAASGMDEQRPTRRLARSVSLTALPPAGPPRGVMAIAPRGRAGTLGLPHLWARRAQLREA